MPTISVKGLNDNSIIVNINDNIQKLNYSRLITSPMVVNDKCNIILNDNNNISYIVQNINLPKENIIISNLNDSIIVLD
jgi:hypothetical protein